MPFTIDGPKQRLHYLANCLEDPAVQTLWDLLPGDNYIFEDLIRTLEVVYGSVGKVEVYRSQLKIRSRMKSETLNDLAQEVRTLTVVAYPGPQDRTTEILSAILF